MKSLSARTQFILRRGVLRWGILVGLVATAVVVGRTPLSVQRSATQGPAPRVVLAVLCFLEWSLGAGWFIGAVLWTVTRKPDIPPQTDDRKSSANTDKGHTS
jgi:hypothetical protein